MEDINRVRLKTTIQITFLIAMAAIDLTPIVSHVLPLYSLDKRMTLYKPARILCAA
jgi:hypothetical protein